MTPAARAVPRWNRFCALPAAAGTLGHILPENGAETGENAGSAGA